MKSSKSGNRFKCSRRWAPLSVASNARQRYACASVFLLSPSKAAILRSVMVRSKGVTSPAIFIQPFQGFRWPASRDQPLRHVGGIDVLAGTQPYRLDKGVDIAFGIGQGGEMTRSSRSRPANCAPILFFLPRWELTDVCCQ